MFDRHEVQHIAITMADGSVSVMQFITLAERTKTGERMEREATDEAIQSEIAKTFPRGVASWRRIAKEDLPATRTNRDAWRDSGTEIAVDPARVKAPASRPTRL